MQCASLEVLCDINMSGKSQKNWFYPRLLVGTTTSNGVLLHCRIDSKSWRKRRKVGKKRVNKTWFKSLEGVSISLVTSQVTHVWPTSNQLQLIASYANLILLSVIWNCQQNQICIICHKAQHPSLDNTWWPKRRERCFSHWLTINITVYLLCLKYGCGDLWLWNEEINETGGN